MTSCARRELFESIAKEVRDEVNLGLEQQTRPELLGIVYNLQHAGRLALEFLITTTLHSDQVSGRWSVVVTLPTQLLQVRELYRAGGQEADESTALYCVAVESVCRGELEPELRARLTPHCRASIELLKIRLGCRSSPE